MACEKEYQKAKEEAPKLHLNHLRERLRKAEESRDRTTARSIKLLIAREACIKQWRCIRACLKPRNSISLDEIDTNSDGVFKTLTDRGDIEASIMANNASRFRLASAYPLNQGCIASALGRFSTSWIGRAILRGVAFLPYSIPYQLWGLLRVIRDFAAAIGGRRNSEDFSRQDFQSYWGSAKEKTSSAFSGLHFGHYKAAAGNDMLSEIHAMMTEMAMKGGFAYSQWKEGLSVMIPKQPGAQTVDKLRAILLFEGDFN